VFPPKIVCFAESAASLSSYRSAGLIVNSIVDNLIDDDIVDKSRTRTIRARRKLMASKLRTVQLRAGARQLRGAAPRRVRL
jgi:hypothetical protein